MARITAHIKPRPSDEKLKRAEARATEEREFERKDTAEIDALRFTHEKRLHSGRKAASKRAEARATEVREFARKDGVESLVMAAEVNALLTTQEEAKAARKAEEKRRVTKELVDKQAKDKSAWKALQAEYNDAHKRTDETKLKKLFEDKEEEARVQKAVGDAAEKHAAAYLSSFTAAVYTRLGAFTSKLTASFEEQARNRQEAASKKESAYKDAVDAINRASQEWAEQHAKWCAQEDVCQEKCFAIERELKDAEEEYFDDSDSDEDEV